MGGSSGEEFGDSRDLRTSSVGTMVMTSHGQTWAHSLHPMHTGRSIVQIPMA